MRKEKRQWAPGQTCFLEKWQNGCATRSRGHQDTHSRAAQTEGLIGTRARHNADKPHTTGSSRHKGASAQPWEAPGITWQIHQEENWLGAGLVPDAQVAAPGRSTSSSTVCTRHGGQAKQQARCKQLALGAIGSPNWGRNITGIKFPSEQLRARAHEAWPTAPLDLVRPRFISPL